MYLPEIRDKHGQTMNSCKLETWIGFEIWKPSTFNDGLAASHIDKPFSSRPWSRCILPISTGLMPPTSVGSLSVDRKGTLPACNPINSQWKRRVSEKVVLSGWNLRAEWRNLRTEVDLFEFDYLPNGWRNWQSFIERGIVLKVLLHHIFQERQFLALRPWTIKKVSSVWDDHRFPWNFCVLKGSRPKVGPFLFLARQRAKGQPALSACDIYSAFWF